MGPLVQGGTFQEIGYSLNSTTPKTLYLVEVAQGRLVLSRPTDPRYPQKTTEWRSLTDPRLGTRRASME